MQAFVNFICKLWRKEKQTPWVFAERQPILLGRKLKLLYDEEAIDSLNPLDGETEEMYNHRQRVISEQRHLIISQRNPRYKELSSKEVLTEEEQLEYDSYILFHDPEVDENGMITVVYD